MAPDQFSLLQAMTPDDSERALLRQGILDLLADRREGATICPSEVPRLLFPDRWRDFMPATREEAVRLCREGRVSICQKGEPIDPTGELRGPIRLRKARDR